MSELIPSKDYLPSTVDPRLYGPHLSGTSIIQNENDCSIRVF